MERIVGVFDSERMSGSLWTLDEFNAYAPRPLTKEQLLETRALRGRLFRQWSEVEPRGKLDLQFPASSLSRSALKAAEPGSSLSK